MKWETAHHTQGCHGSQGAVTQNNECSLFTFSFGNAAGLSCFIKTWPDPLFLSASQTRGEEYAITKFTHVEPFNYRVTLLWLFQMLRDSCSRT